MNAADPFNLGNLLREQGRLEEAAAAYREATDSRPRFQEALQNLGLTLVLLGRYAQGLEALSRAAEIDPDLISALLDVGDLLHGRDETAEAIPFYRAAVLAKPDSVEAHCHLGNAFKAMGRLAEAAKAYRAGLDLDPDCIPVLNNLGLVLGDRGFAEEAIRLLHRTVELDPGFANGWTGLGSAFQRAGKSGDAIECHGRALALDPGNKAARFGRAVALANCQRHREALADFDEHLKLDPDHHLTRSFRLFLLNFRDDLSRESLFREHLAYGSAVEAGKPLPEFPNDPSPDRRLRIAFLSPDLRNHPVMSFLEPLLRHLDRERFEVILYHDHYCVDTVSERIRSGAGLWRHFAGLPDRIVEETVRADAPDVLVDLAGHTGFNRLELVARRLAPVQIAYLGYPNTTGLSAMDFRFTDAIADPPGDTDHLHTERLVRFAPTNWAYQPPADAPEPAPPPSENSRFVTFGSFNSFSKIQPRALRVWREVLAAVPGSRLVLKSYGFQPEEHRGQLIEAGLAPDRFELLPMTAGIAEHLAAYSKIDIALDPFPYNGTTTTCEALWMGVPVVTLAGDRHSGRVGASLLTALGRSEWIAENPGAYVRIASDLASQAAGRRALRRELRGEMRRSALLDHSGQAERFGAAIRAAWALWCEEARSRTLAVAVD